MKKAKPMPKDQSETRMQAPWFKPVLLALEEPGQYVTIATTQAAPWALIEDWPVEDGPALDRALRSAPTSSRKRTGEEARKAFVEAAIEAGIDMKG
jgi:hypothetical protein